jgi:hypothetical protein
MDLEVFHLDERDAIVTTRPGDRVPMRIPVQGGWAIVVGVRATNLTAGPGMMLVSSFRDLCSDEIVKADFRSPTLADNGDGRAVVTLDSVSNLQLCPTPTSLRHLFEEPFRFTLELIDSEGKHGEEEITFIPVCPEGAAECECECDQRYQLGTCPPTGPEPVVPAC